MGVPRPQFTWEIDKCVVQRHGPLFFLRALRRCSPVCERPPFPAPCGCSVNGDIVIQTNTKPTQVILRFATTTDDIRRDFRLIKGECSG